MLLLKHNNSVSFLYKFLIIYTFIRESYQQTTQTTKIATNKDLKFCIKNHSLSNTLQTFWHEANADCELEPKSLMQVYSQLMIRSKADEDQCSALLKLQMRKKLINLLATQLEEALVAKTLLTNEGLQQDLKLIEQIDKRVAHVIWERVINEVYWFIEAGDIVREILLLKDEEMQITAFENLLNKLILDEAQIKALIPLLTFHITTIYKKKTFSSISIKSLEKLYRRLPKELRLLYESSKESIGLLNYHHSEYLYAPRDNGPDAERRLALTWSETKNSTDSDGHLFPSFNAEGLVAFGNRYGSALKYLYADVGEQAVFFWIGSGVKSSQWWRILWPHDLFRRDGAAYIMLENNETQELLCSTNAYDENRRYMALLRTTENMENSSCYWLVTRF